MKANLIKTTVTSPRFGQGAETSDYRTDWVCRTEILALVYFTKEGPEGMKIDWAPKPRISKVDPLSPVTTTDIALL